MKPWRKIVRRERVNEEHIGKGRGFTWWMVEVTTVYLECGHAKVYRGCGVPAQKVRCSECLDPLEAGPPGSESLHNSAELLVERSG